MIHALFDCQRLVSWSFFGMQPPEGCDRIVQLMPSVGDKFGPYVLEALLGAGGMGQVYRAKDTRLGRTVALKVLTPEMHSRDDVQQRFNREARAVSSLTHPNICAVHDVGCHEDLDYLVMEYLEGETLESRLKRNALSLREVYRYATEIANALDRAHRSGIVHRDLKPSNVMLTKHGAKLLDFGIAKAMLMVDPGEQTVSHSLTRPGIIIGTVAYMAPEQLEGRPADARTDIFAFGILLYEMLTRQKPFAGDSEASVIAAILTREPQALRHIDPLIAPSLENLILTCLRKEPDDRWQSARDIALELKYLAESPDASSEPSQQTRTRFWLSWAGILLAAGLVIGLTAWFLNRGQKTMNVVALDINAPAETDLSASGSAISPDGRYVAFVATTEGKQRLWLRPLNSRNARMLEDTDDAQFPFWSPDSGSLAFFARNTLKRVDLDGVGSRNIATAANGRGGTWSRDGVIIYSPKLSSQLWKVPATGGDPAPATVLDYARRDARHDFPQFLPDGKHFLFFAHSADPKRTGPQIGTIDDPRQIRPLTELQGNPFQAVFAGTGDSRRSYLLYVRQNSVVAQRFNAHELRLEGESQPIISRESFSVASSPGFLNLTVSDTGTLLDGGTQRQQNQLVWRTRNGRSLGPVGELGDYATPSISPDASRIAVTNVDPISGDYAIWVQDVKRQIRSRFTFEKGLNYYPIWSPDGKDIIYTSDAAGRPTLFRKAALGTGEAEPLLRSQAGVTFAYDISADGRFLLFAEISDIDRGDIWVLALDKHAPPFPFLKTSAGEEHPQFSPSAVPGRWIVYTSDESGTDQVYVRQFTGGAAAQGKWQVSLNGGRYPRWRGNGSDILFLAPNGTLMTTPIRCTKDSVDLSAPRPLFDAALPPTPFSRYPYDLSSDGQKLLLVEASREHSPGNLTVIVNWSGLLKR